MELRDSRRAISFISLVLVALLALLMGPGAIGAGAQDSKSPERDAGRTVVHKAGGKLVGTGGAQATTYYIGMPSAEPTLGLDEKGKVYYTAADINRRNSVEVIRSDNGGSKWTVISPKIGPQNAHAVTLDPYIFVDRWTGRVFNIDLTVACSLLSFSDDEGESWSTNPLACGRPVNDHQTLFAGPPSTSTTVGYDNVVYYCWNDVASSACSKSIDGGLTFRPTGAPAFTGYQPDEETVGFYNQKGLCGGLHGHGVVGPDGTVYLPRELCGRPMVAISKDEGLSWNTVQVAPRAFMSSNDNSVAVDAKNNIYYVGVTKERIPFLVYSRDGGKNWSVPIDISAPGLTEGNLVTVDAVAPGKVAIAYMGSENSPYPKCSKKEDGCESTDYTKTTWNGYTTISANLFDKSPTFYTATVNDPKDPMKRHTCGPRRCGSTIFDFIDVVVGPDGVAYTAWTDACTLMCAGAGMSDQGNEGLMSKMVGGPSLK